MPGDKKGVLVAALPRRGALPPAVYEVVAAGRAAADAVKEPLSAVTFGGRASEFAKDLGERGCDKVWTVSGPALDVFDAESYAAAVAALAEKEGLGTILMAASVAGRSLAARLSVRLKAGVAAEVCEIAADAAGVKAKRYQYSGNIVAELVFKSEFKILTVQPMVFARAAKQPGRQAQIAPLDAAPAPGRVEFVSFQPEESGEVDLGAAERIVSGGRGLGNAEGFKLIREFAQLLGAAVGASRAVVDSGWIAYRHQVGLTGRTVHPKLYVACGISGQVQHLAGMASTPNIVAINTDPACPMMQIASLAVEGDLYQLLPQIIAEIKNRRGVGAAA